jgi:hypothetical protein
MDLPGVHNLPKLLLTVLNELSVDKNLNHWNIQANGNTVYVNMRFVTPGCEDTSTPLPRPGYGFRHKSGSEKARDFNRFQTWKANNTLQEFNMSTNVDGEEHKYRQGYMSGKTRSTYKHLEQEAQKSSTATANQPDLHVSCTHENTKQTEQEMNGALSQQEYTTVTANEPDLHLYSTHENTEQTEQEMNNALSQHSDDDCQMPLPEWTSMSKKKEGYDYTQLFTKVIEDDTIANLVCLTKDKRIATYHMHETLLDCYQAFQFINQNDENYAEQMDFIDSKQNVMGNHNIKEHLDNLYEMVRDYSTWYPFFTVLNDIDSNLRNTIGKVT